MFLGIADLPRCFHQVLLVDVVPGRALDTMALLLCEGSPLVPDGEHSCFCDDVAKVGTIEAIG